MKNVPALSVMPVSFRSQILRFVFVPAKLRLLEHHQAVYKCPECSSDDHSKISKATMPRSLISHSKTGSPSIVAHIAAMK